jgi:hypothetical protein
MFMVPVAGTMMGLQMALPSIPKQKCLVTPGVAGMTNGKDAAAYGERPRMPRATTGTGIPRFGSSARAGTVGRAGMVGAGSVGMVSVGAVSVGSVTVGSVGRVRVGAFTVGSSDEAEGTVV